MSQTFKKDAGPKHRFQNLKNLHTKQNTSHLLLPECRAEFINDFILHNIMYPSNVSFLRIVKMCVHCIYIYVGVCVYIFSY
jgi:hypothetical protein